MNRTGMLLDTMELRDLTRTDWPQLLALNLASVRELSPLGEAPGMATRLYDAMETAADSFDRMVCDVNILPPNQASLAFHAARGYREVGRLTHGSEKVVALLSKELQPDAGGPV